MVQTLVSITLGYRASHKNVKTALLLYSTELASRIQGFISKSVQVLIRDITKDKKKT